MRLCMVCTGSGVGRSSESSTSPVMKFSGFAELNTRSSLKRMYHVLAFTASSEDGASAVPFMNLMSKPMIRPWKHNLNELTHHSTACYIFMPLWVFWEKLTCPPLSISHINMPSNSHLKVMLARNCCIQLSLLSYSFINKLKTAAIFPVVGFLPGWRLGRIAADQRVVSCTESCAVRTVPGGDDHP